MELFLLNNKVCSFQVFFVCLFVCFVVSVH